MAKQDSTRQAQACDRCGQVDDHPRHVDIIPDRNMAAAPALVRQAISNGAGDWSVADLVARDRTVHHFDCGAADGCEVCQTSERLTGGTRHQALVDVKETAEHQQELARLLGAAADGVEQDYDHERAYAQNGG